MSIKEWSINRAEEILKNYNDLKMAKQVAESTDSNNQDIQTINQIIHEIDETIAVELGRKERIVVNNFLIRKLGVEEVNDRLDKKIGQTFERTTIYRIKKKALFKLAAHGIVSYSSKVNDYLQRYL